MKRSTGSLLFLLAGAALGVAATALFAWNPFGWAWHPGVIRQEPDSYPNGSMAHARGEASGERRVIYWRAPMDPNYRSDRPGKSPMGMDLVPVYDDAGADDGTVRVSPRFLQNFAVRTAEVERGAVPLSIRTVGVLAHNDEKVVSVNTKFEGWIERARVNNVGESVERGDVLFDIYSPELVTTQQEYIATIDYVERLRQAGAYPDAVERARSLLEAARARLRHWDVTETQIAGLEAAGRASRTVQVLAPASGFIVEKMGDSLEGMKLTPGMTVLKIADHSTLWAKAEFYAEDLRHVHEGNLASIEVDAFPERRWTGTILFFRSAVNPETRALTAFVEIANPDLALRPMMYVNVSIQAEGARDAVVAPAESVLHTGARAVVIVDRGAGVFEPREVELGLAAEGMQEVTAGLAPGERVVVSSQFLIDSESNLRAATSQLLRGAEDDTTATPRPSPTHR